MGSSRQENWSCHFLLQGIFLAQGSSPDLLHSDFLLSEPQGKPLICIRQVSSCYNRTIKGYLSIHSHAYPHMLIFIKFWIFKRKWKSLSLVRLFVIPWTIQSMEFSRPEYGSGYSLPQGIFPTQGLNTGLQHCRQLLYQLSHKGSPRMLEWLAYPFSSGSSWPRNQTRVSCLQADSLPTELSGKTFIHIRQSL